MSDEMMTPARLAEIAQQIRNELPEGALDPRTIPNSPAPPPSFVEVLKKNPAWTALQAQLVDEAARLVGKLLTMEPQVYKSPNGTTVQTREDFTMQVEALRGEIRGMLRVLEAPAVAQRAIELRRL